MWWRPLTVDGDRKSTRLNSSHVSISYAVFCLKKKTQTYCGEWALSREQEKHAFEKFVDFAITRWEQYPDFHIYHYAPYEPSALKRLMGRYVTREDEIDRMLRTSLFVDLYQVVRHGIRASVERYSIKELESLFSFTRATPLEDASQALATVQVLLEVGGPSDDHGRTQRYRRGLQP